MIHVCYALYDATGKYSKLAGVSMLSVFENTHEQITIHLIHDNTLTFENRDKFIYLTAKYGHNINFYNVEKLIPERINGIKKSMPNIVNTHFSIASMYRLFVTDVLSEDIDKLIYLDSGDTLVNLDISELWDIKLGDNPLAATPEAAYINIDDNSLSVLVERFNGAVKAEDYFNAGILLLNLDYIRKHIDILRQGYDFVCNNKKCDYFDQDILNYCFANNYLKLPVKFNCSVRWYRIINKSNRIEKNIYHFNGGANHKFYFDVNDICNRMYIDYFIKTPWNNADIFGNIDKALHLLFNQGRLNLLEITKLMSGKVRAFFTEENNTAAVKNIFGLLPNEELLTMPILPPPPSTEVDLTPFVKIINESRDKNFWFILVNDDNYIYIRDILIKNNLIEGVHFINGTLLLNEQHGIFFNSYFVIHDM